MTEDANLKSDNKVIKFLKELFPTIIIGIGSFLLILLLHFLGVFNTLELKLYDFRFKLRGPLSGLDSNSALPNAEGFIDLTEEFIDKNNNGTWDPPEPFTDINLNGTYDIGEPYVDKGNGIWDLGEPYVDLDGNGLYDEWDEFQDMGNGKRDIAENFIDINNNNIWDGKNNKYDIGIDSINYDGVGCWVEEECINHTFDIDEEFTDEGNGKWDGEEPFEDINGNGKWDDSEPFRDDNGNGKWDGEEPFEDINGNGKWDDSETFIDLNGNGEWSPAEDYIDTNENGIWDIDEEFTDIGNGVWNEGEAFIDLDECEKNGKVCHNSECVEYKECHDINQNGQWDKGLDVVIVENDDESYRLIPEPYPYPRGSVWYRVVKNLTDAGAKVIVIDYMFDKPDHPTKNLKNYKDNNSLDFPIIDGDEKFAEAVAYAESKGTKVILGSKLAYEASLAVPFYYLPPTNNIMGNDKINITDGLVDIPSDEDGFHRGYYPFRYAPLDTNMYFTLGIETILQYKNMIDMETNIDEKKMKFESNDRSNAFTIDFYAQRNKGFLINFFGPPSNSFNTFARFPITNILDTQDYNLISDQDYYDNEFEEMVYVEDQNWMDKYVDPILAPIFEAQGFINPFKGKIVILGTSLSEEQDFKPTPYSNYKGQSYQFPGVEYHANAIQHIINGNYIETPLGALEFHKGSVDKHILIIALLICVTLVCIFKAPPLWGFLIMIVEVLIWLSYSVGAFVTDSLWIFKLIIGQPLNIPGIGESAMVPVLFPISAIILPFGINLTYKLFTEGQDKKFLKDTFGTFVSPALIDQMYDSKETPTLGGTDVYNTCFFSDIASFSSFSEKMTAPELVILLNEYLEEMTNILLDNGGTLDKYIGDAIIAIFGSPIPIKDHEYRGVLSICQMNEKLEELRKKWKSEGDKWPDVVHNMRHRIGLNTGQIVAGNMGSSVRMSYTMMGDAVNTTARLESGAKQYGIESQVGEKVYEATKDKFFYRILDHVRVKGKVEPVKTFELISEIGKEPDNYKELVPLWDNAVKLYTEQHWDDAIKTFKKCDKLEEDYIGRPTNPSKFFIARCEEFKAEPPGKDWDGIYSLKSK